MTISDFVRFARARVPARWRNRRRLLIAWLGAGFVLKAAALIATYGLLFPPFKP